MGDDGPEYIDWESFEEFEDVEESLEERLANQRRMILDAVPDWYGGAIHPTVATDPRPPAKPDRRHAELYGHGDGVARSEHEFTFDLDVIVRKRLVAHWGGGFVLVPASYVRVFEDADGLLSVDLLCWCGKEFTEDLGMLMHLYCSTEHAVPEHEYPCERCGRPMMAETPWYGTAYMFCSTRCKRARDGISLGAMREIYDDVCDVCGELVDDDTAALFMVEPLNEWNADRIGLYRLAHRACLGDHQEAPRLDHLGREPLPNIPRTGALERINQSQGEFYVAQSDKNYSLIAQLLRKALPDVLPAMLEMSVDFGRVYVANFPLTGPCVAAAALYPDPTVDAHFDEIAASPLSENAVAPGAVVELRRAMMGIGTALNGVAPRSLDRKMLRSAAGVSDGRLFARALDYLIKAGRVFATAGGYSMTPDVEPFEKPRPKEAPSDRAPVEPTLVNLARMPRVLGTDTYSFPHWREDEPPAPTRTIAVTDWSRTPQDQRPPGKSSVGVTASTTWLFTYSYSPSKTQVHAATVVGREGVTVRRIDLSAKPRHWVARSDREWMTILDEDLTVWVYRADGELIDSIALRTVTEVAAILSDPNSELWRFRCVDYDLQSRRVVFTFDDAAWCLSPDGEVIWAFRMPQKPYPSGAWRVGNTPPAVHRIAADIGLARADLTAREAAALLHEAQQPGKSRRGTSERGTVSRRSPVLRMADHLGALSADRIESTQFVGDLVLLSTSYGLNVEISVEGQVTRLWNSRSTFHPLGRTDGAVLGFVHGHFLKVADTALVRSGDRSPARLDETPAVGADPTSVVMSADGNPLAGERWVATLAENTLTVASNADWKSTAYELPSAPRAIVVLAGALRVHTNTEHALIPLP
ncbi:hypothetical protein J2X85_004083 [Microbacterium trichothecenolyticum]|uniref:hypothetical protein n=1 Tax=Microbacterium trichothecenolyticum TaxID=69370 RepID=UPI0028646B0B|nr:hypothetical protein [Microbacterium trichothecenolyticum]MDR7187022.1 hypothetical protein [Microbacterium trichothecenolyticum]